MVVLSKQDILDMIKLSNGLISLRFSSDIDYRSTLLMIKYIISGTILEQGSTTISPTTFDIVKNNSEKPMSSPLQIKCTSDDLRRKYVMYDKYNDSTIICERNHTHAYPKCYMMQSSPFQLVTGKKLDGYHAQSYWNVFEKYHKYT